jgi:hypothetical protein
MDALRSALRLLVAAGATLTLLGPAEVRAQEAEAPTQEAGTRAETARARVGLGVGGTSLIVRGSQGALAAGAWAAIPLGRHFQLTPSITLYQIDAYGSGPGLKTELSAGLEYVFTWPRFRFVPGVLLSHTRRGFVFGDTRSIRAGVSLGLQVPVDGPLEIFARSEHRIFVNAEEGGIVNQVIVGPALGF